MKNIYNVAAEVTETLSGPLAQQFRRVVLVEWPRPGVLSLGFVTGRMDSPKEPFRSMVAVYIPTAPNPTSGFVALHERGGRNRNGLLGRGGHEDSFLRRYRPAVRRLRIKSDPEFYYAASKLVGVSAERQLIPHGLGDALEAETQIEVPRSGVLPRRPEVR